MAIRPMRQDTWYTVYAFTIIHIALPNASVVPHKKIINII